MAQVPENPLLRLNNPTGDARQTGARRFIRSRTFSPGAQRGSSVGQAFSRLGSVFDERRDPLELRRDPNGMAPERLLVFELTGDISGFSRAAAGVPGLEFVGAEEEEADEFDKSPVLYLLIPDAAALRQVLTLWRDWQNNRDLPPGLAPWKSLFSHLRAIRPWGPRDRVTEQDLAVLAQEHADANGNVRLELELVFRTPGEAVETAARQAVQAVGGTVLSATRIPGAGYHALLTSVPQAELMRVAERGSAGLVGEESILHIRPQSISQVTLFEVGENAALPASNSPTKSEPIAAIFDAVPLAGHPQLNNRLVVDDVFNLEPLSVGPRVHGTAMASAVVHGDLNGPPLQPLDRRVYFVNVMYAPASAGESERFPERLPADMFHEAVVRLKEGVGATAPTIIIVNASLGDLNKPFSGRMSGWARVVDCLAFKYGILFVISAGNQPGDLITADMQMLAFEALTAEERAKIALRASGADMANRRLLSPAESVNALTVGGLHGDNHPPAAPQASVFDVFANTGMTNVSSALGPGYGNSTKPDVVAVGGRHHVRCIPDGAGHRLRPMAQGAIHFGGIRVACPPVPPGNFPTSRSIGTSVAAALVTGMAVRVHESLEDTYADFLAIPPEQRAVLLKSLMVHSARWTIASDLIVEILGPDDPRQHVRRRDNVRRYLGFGAVDAGIVLACTQDRATLWAVGRLARERGHKFALPLPVVMSGKARPHEIAATVAWFAPPKFGTVRYRGARLKVLEPEEISAIGVGAMRDQPDANQSHRGTVIHRRWSGDKAASLSDGQTLEMVVQREPDEEEQEIPYAMVATIAMPGVAGIYEQVKAKLAIQPKVAVQV